MRRRGQTKITAGDLNRAISIANADGRTWESLPKADKDRLIERARHARTTFPESRDVYVPTRPAS